MPGHCEVAMCSGCNLLTSKDRIGQMCVLVCSGTNHLPGAEVQRCHMSQCATLTSLYISAAGESPEHSPDAAATRRLQGMCKRSGVFTLETGKYDVLPESAQ